MSWPLFFIRDLPQDGWQWGNHLLTLELEWVWSGLSLERWGRKGSSNFMTHCSFFMAILLLFNVSGTWIIMSFMRCSRGCDFYQWELTRFIHVHLFGGNSSERALFSGFFCFYWAEKHIDKCRVYWVVLSFEVFIMNTSKGCIHNRKYTNFKVAKS